MFYSPKKDKYKSKRGGESKLLDIICRECGKPVLVYQKDGPGSLLRLYLDRIHSPQRLTGLQHLPLSDIPYLKCLHCSKLLATPYIYAKEKRPAYRLHPDTIIKRTRKTYR